MDKSEIYQYLTQKGIAFEASEHKAVFNMEELNGAELPYPEQTAKNLFVRDDKKQNYYLITLKGEKRADLKAFRRQNDLRNLSFASEAELMEYMSLTAGSVTPFGLLNDPLHRVIFYLDSEFEGNMIGVHPNDNTATVWLCADDLAKLIREHGNEVNIIRI